MTEEEKPNFITCSRPAFNYMFYLFLLAGFPFSVLYAVDNELGKVILEGMRMYLNAIPNIMWESFTVGYLGYAAARSYDKKNQTHAK